MYLQFGGASNTSSGLENIMSLKNGKKLHVSLNDASFILRLQKNKYVYLFGELFYYTKINGNIRLIDADSQQYLKKVFSENSLHTIIPRLEGQYIGIFIDKDNQKARIFSDRYARLDTFYSNQDSNFCFATDLDLIFEKVKPKHDQKMLAHLFSAYGWYTPKGLTIYNNVKQLRVGEIITLSGTGIKSETIKFKPLKIREYGEDDLDVYYRILRDSVIARANRDGKTWVSSSSGWDSSSLLGILVNEFGPKNVDMLAGSMQYSDETAVINKFELDKIKKIGKFYGIKPNIVTFDIKSKNATDYWKGVLPFFKSKHMYSYASYNFSKLSKGLFTRNGADQVIFNGETSDSFHNFGFSQFATFFHTEKTFTEYADKMNCYLYGPSFLKKVFDGTFKKDKVFQIFKNMMPGVEFNLNWKNREEAIERYLQPFFYGSPRIPFAKTSANPALTQRGQKEVYCFPYREYMPEVLSGLSESNIYSWLIYLYHSFHSQGSTVNIHKHAMESNDHRWRAPYNDYRLIEFLSKAPESWGRGLDLNNTKYPLKWVVKNKIKFPYELLDTGPHSYLYDVIEGFSLGAEVTYRSGVTEFFKESVKSKPYHSLLSDKYFDIRYLDKLVSDFLAGKEASGQDFNSLVSLITLCITGWY